MTALRKMVPQTPRSGIAPRWGSFDDLDRVFDNFFRNAMTNIHLPVGSLSDIAVKMNISETDKEYTVTAELPGLERADVELAIEDGVLKLSGEKQQESEEEGKTFHRIERSYGRFSRTLQLPDDAAEDQVKATMKNGVLSVAIGKRAMPEKAKKTINIASA